MATIAPTRVGTSDDASLCKGFAMFPALGNVNAAISVNDTTSTFFDTSVSLLLLRISARASAGIFLGSCGPAYGFNFLASGETDGNSLALEVTDDSVEAGFMFGLTLGANVEISIDRLAITWVWDGWNSGIRTSWEKFFSSELGIRIDLLGLLFELVLLLLKESGREDNPLQKVANLSPTLLGTYGIVDGAGGQLGEEGRFTVRPTFSLPIDLVHLSPALKAVDKALGALGGGFGLGPTIGVAIPVTAKIASVRLADASREVTYVRNESGGEAFKGTTTGEEIEKPTKMTVQMEHRPGFDLSFGIFYDISILKFLSLGGSVSFGLLQVLGIELSFGAYDNLVDNTIGQTTIGRGMGGVAQAAGEGFTEFVLMPPGYANA
ncbi:hypothetical protein EON79_08715 [bacterium]|nr:MAG: hypothetical protein EON79_08715 [bacterium]